MPTRIKRCIPDWGSVYNDTCAELLERRKLLAKILLVLSHCRSTVLTELHRPAINKHFPVPLSPCLKQPPSRHRATSIRRGLRRNNSLMIALRSEASVDNNHVQHRAANRGSKVWPLGRICKTVRLNPFWYMYTCLQNVVGHSKSEVAQNLNKIGAWFLRENTKGSDVMFHATKSHNQACGQSRPSRALDRAVAKQMQPQGYLLAKYFPVL